jgi:hypothetical protein
VPLRPSYIDVKITGQLLPLWNNHSDDEVLTAGKHLCDGEARQRAVRWALDAHGVDVENEAGTEARACAVC